MADEEKFNRPEFMNELRVINADTGGKIQPILDLFEKFQKKGGVLVVKGNTYRENWTGKMLQSIELDHRAADYEWLADILAKDPSKFFAMLEILNDDNVMQIMKQAWTVFSRNPAGKFAIKLTKRFGVSGGEILSETSDALGALVGNTGSAPGNKLSDRAKAWALKQ